MGTQHTPAPWKVDDEIGIYAVTPGNLHRIATVHHPLVGEIDANANLIAAAPDLYRENEQAALSLEEAAKLLSGHGLKGCAGIMERQAARCREAAAKARQS